METIPQLTTRERQVLQLAADGLDNDEIARTLCLAPSTVTSYFIRIYERWHIRGQRQEAIYRYMQGGRYATTE